MINKLSANELLEKMSKQREKYWNKAYKLGQKAERKRILEILKDFWFLDYYKNATFLKGSFMKEFKKEVLKDD